MVQDRVMIANDKAAIYSGTGALTCSKWIFKDMVDNARNCDEIRII